MSDKNEERRQALAKAEIDTLAIRTGHVRTPEGEHSEPIFATSSYVFDSAAEAAARFSGEHAGNVYSRYTNPTVRTFEQRIAALEGAEAAVATASGMAAILSTCMALLNAGDHIVCSRAVFGSTTILLGKYMQRFGVTTSFVDAADVAQWQQALTADTRLLLLETPSNPLAEIADIGALARIAQTHGAYLAVDNCFCTPALQKPLDFGADIIIHSATKYLDGQGRCLGGVVLGRQELMEEVLGFVRAGGPSMAPFNAWVFLKGLETLRLRMEAHSANALQLAQWLQSQVGIEKVFYSGLPDHPQHELATRQQRAYGGVLAFRVAGDQQAAWRFIDATRLMSLTANLGDAKTTIVHPATTTHGRLTAEEKQASGITENLIRVAVGLEAVADLQADLQRGLNAL
ncbi:MAG: O-succinylhomoserine sulfhydrylase [Pseudomonadales bacterium]